MGLSFERVRPVHAVLAFVLMLVVGVGAGAGVAWWRGGGAAADEPASGEVRTDRLNRVTSADGQVTVEIDGSALSGDGVLTIDPEGESGSRWAGDPRAWAIDLEGAELVGDAVIRVAVPPAEAGEPVPLVSSAAPGARRERVAGDVTREGDEVVVMTDRLATWYVDPWQDAVTWALDRLVDGAGEADTGEARAPRCEGEQAAVDAGYVATAEGGDAARWCLGLEGSGPVLRAVGAGPYGVRTEHTGGLGERSRDADDVLTLLAGRLSSPAPEPGGTAGLLAPGGVLELGLDGSDGPVTLRVDPGAGGYLLSALEDAVATHLRLVGAVTGRRADDGARSALLASLDTQPCLSAYADRSGEELVTPATARRFLASALAEALACVGRAGERAELGLDRGAVLAPMAWVMRGVGESADVAVGAGPDDFAVEGTRIAVEPPLVIDDETVGDLLIPAGTCGSATGFGWDQAQPIQLTDGEGEAFDADQRGAGILETSLLGAVDVTGDGRDEAFVVLKCTGSPKELCCAGRTSIVDYVAVLDLTGDVPRRVGTTITPTSPTASDGYEQSRYFVPEELRLDGTRVVTYQRLDYPEQLDPAEVAALEGEVVYALEGETWTPQ